jgi:hypothetical protein
MISFGGTTYSDLGIFTQWWGICLLLLYGLQCVAGFQVQRVPARDRTRVHTVLLTGLGASVVLLAFYVSWFGFVAAGDSPLVCGILLIVSTVLFAPAAHIQVKNAKNKPTVLRRSLRFILSVSW